MKNIEILAEIRALENSEDCTKGNHSHDCPCGSYEEGFLKGYTECLIRIKENLVDITEFIEWAEEVEVIKE